MSDPLILEVTPKGTIRHEMPEFLFNAFKRATDLRTVKSVRQFLAFLPSEFKALIKSGELVPHPEPKLRGHLVSWVFYDELATPEQIERALKCMEANK